MPDAIGPFHLQLQKDGRPPFQDGQTVLKTCSRHGLIEHRISGRAEPRWRCKRCVGERVLRRQREVRALLVREAGGRCSVCGYDRCLLNLHFHHVDPGTKAFPMSMASGKSLAAYREEARKCVLVCANCHGEIEAGMIGSPAPGAVFDATRQRTERS